LEEWALLDERNEGRKVGGRRFVPPMESRECRSAGSYRGVSDPPARRVASPRALFWGVAHAPASGPLRPEPHGNQGGRRWERRCRKSSPPPASGNAPWNAFKGCSFFLEGSRYAADQAAYTRQATRQTSDTS